MHSFYLPPASLDLITVTGPDAVKLLQGQLTCDVEAVSDPGFTPGALCNNKGRVLATFILVRQGSVFHLVLNQGLGAVFATALKKYLPFYKCELKQIPAGESACFGLVGEQATALAGVNPLPEDRQCAALTDGWICNLDQAQRQYLVYSRALQTTANHALGFAAGALPDWLLTGLQAGQFPFVPGDAEKYTPQDLHLDRHDYVSFTKGCYTGQEIVARMHYRGKLKKQLFLLNAPAAVNTTLSEPMTILDANGRVLGATMKVLQSHSGALYALAILPADVERAGLAFVANAEGLRFNLRSF